MYKLKRLLNSIVHDCSVVGAPANIPPIRDAAQQALAEVERLEKDALDAPQEMRDFFAGAALIGLFRRSEDKTITKFAVELSWELSDKMMFERAKRINARREEPKDSIGQ